MRNIFTVLRKWLLYLWIQPGNAYGNIAHNQKEIDSTIVDIDRLSIVGINSTFSFCPGTSSSC